MSDENVNFGQKATGLIRVIRALGNSVKGLRYALRNEAAARQELLLLIVGAIIAFSLDLSAVERILMIGSLVLVLVVELLNSAIEAVVDRVGVEFHALSGAAKDMGSAAVLVSLLFAGGVWAAILFS